MSITIPCIIHTKPRCALYMAKHSTCLSLFKIPCSRQETHFPHSPHLSLGPVIAPNKTQTKFFLYMKY